jgi:hypothetical protein
VHVVERAEVAAVRNRLEDLVPESERRQGWRHGFLGMVTP